jgi:hypothetical protein
MAAMRPAAKGAEHGLGAFSVSLAVKDLGATRSFYEKLGFCVSAGDASQNWRIITKGEQAIGRFPGMHPVAR